MIDEAGTAPITRELQECAEHVQVVADELERIEQELTADEVTYQIHDGEVIVVQLAYDMADAESG